MRKDVGITSKLKGYIDEFMKEQYEYKSYREVIMRDVNPEELIKKIAEKLKIEDIETLSHRWKRKSMKFRCKTAYMMNNYCGLGISEIAKRFKTFQHPAALTYAHEVMTFTNQTKPSWLYNY